MAKRAERGFTVIEVMLFLAITGGLFALLMLGVNNGVTQQRYLDSVRSYKSVLQGQYSEVVNTRNEKQPASCRNDGSIDLNGTSRETSRGTTKCVLLGRAIRVTDDGRKLLTSSITGYDNPNGGRSSTLSDVSLLTDYYHAKLAQFDEETLDVDWGSQLMGIEAAGRRDASKAVILILKSPATGLVRVFAAEDTNGALNANPDLTSFIRDPNSATKLLKSCVDGNSGLLPKQLVIVNPTIASPDAVVVSDDRDGECRI